MLGGKGSYTDERVLKNVGEATIPRLFHGSNASGTFKSKRKKIVFLTLARVAKSPINPPLSLFEGQTVCLDLTRLKILFIV